MLVGLGEEGDGGAVQRQPVGALDRQPVGRLGQQPARQDVIVQLPALPGQQQHRSTLFLREQAPRGLLHQLCPAVAVLPFRQRRAATLRLVADRPRRASGLDPEAVHALQRDGLVVVERGIARLPA